MSVIEQCLLQVGLKVSLSFCLELLTSFSFVLLLGLPSKVALELLDLFGVHGGQRVADVFLAIFIRTPRNPLTAFNQCGLNSARVAGVAVATIEQIERLVKRGARQLVLKLLLEAPCRQTVGTYLFRIVFAVLFTEDPVNFLALGFCLALKNLVNRLFVGAWHTVDSLVARLVNGIGSSFANRVIWLGCLDACLTRPVFNMSRVRIVSAEVQDCLSHDVLHPAHELAGGAVFPLLPKPCR